MKTPSPSHRFTVSTPTTPKCSTPQHGGMFDRRESFLQSPVNVSISVRSESDNEEVRQELYEGEGTACIPYTKERIEVLITVMVMNMRQWTLCKSASQKDKLWETIEDKLVAEGFPAMIRGRGTDIRRKYQSLLKTYKEIEDWNSKSGRNRRKFKYGETFDNAVRKAEGEGPEMNVTVDAGGEPAAASSGIRPRKHPKGRNLNSEEKKTELLEREVNSKIDYMQKMLEFEQRKVDLLDKLVTHITSS